jgi:hypothetical protein
MNIYSNETELENGIGGLSVYGPVRYYSQQLVAGSTAWIEFDPIWNNTYAGKYLVITGSEVGNATDITRILARRENPYYRVECRWMPDNTTEYHVECGNLIGNIDFDTLNDLRSLYSDCIVTTDEGKQARFVYQAVGELVEALSNNVPGYGYLPLTNSERDRIIARIAEFAAEQLDAQFYGNPDDYFSDVQTMQDAILGNLLDILG